MTALGGRRRWAMTGGAVALVVALLAWPMFTYVGIPDDHFSSAPGACQLVSEQTVREVIGQTASTREGDSADHSGGSALGLAHQTRQRTCRHVGPGAFDGPAGGSSVDITVYWYTSTQFGLGPTGADRAERHFHTNFEARDRGRADCLMAMRDGGGQACGMPYSQFGANVFVQEQNLYIHVSFSALPGDSPPELPDGWLDQQIAAVAEDVLVALDGVA